MSCRSRLWPKDKCLPWKFGERWERGYGPYASDARFAKRWCYTEKCGGRSSKRLKWWSTENERVVEIRGKSTRGPMWREDERVDRKDRRVVWHSKMLAKNETKEIGGLSRLLSRSEFLQAVRNKMLTRFASINVKRSNPNFSLLMFHFHLGWKSLSLRLSFFILPFFFLYHQLHRSDSWTSVTFTDSSKIESNGAEILQDWSKLFWWFLRIASSHSGDEVNVVRMEPSIQKWVIKTQQLKTNIIRQFKS